jgi:hypothetical protein
MIEVARCEIFSFRYIAFSPADGVHLPGTGPWFCTAVIVKEHHRLGSSMEASKDLGIIGRTRHHHFQTRNMHEPAFVTPECCRKTRP